MFERAFCAGRLPGAVAGDALLVRAVQGQLAPLVQLSTTHWAPFEHMRFEQSELSHEMTHLELARQSMLHLAVSTQEIVQFAPGEQRGAHVPAPSQLSAQVEPFAQAGAQFVCPTHRYGVLALASLPVPCVAASRPPSSRPASAAASTPSAGPASAGPATAGPASAAAASSLLPSWPASAGALAPSMEASMSNSASWSWWPASPTWVASRPKSSVAASMEPESVWVGLPASLNASSSYSSSRQPPLPRRAAAATKISDRVGLDNEP